MIYNISLMWYISYKIFKGEGMATDERHLLLSVTSVGQNCKDLRFNSSLIFSLFMTNGWPQHGQTLGKVSVVIGSLLVENSLLQDPQGAILVYQQRRRNGFASTYPFRQQPSVSWRENAGVQFSLILSDPPSLVLMNFDSRRTLSSQLTRS